MQYIPTIQGTDLARPAGIVTISRESLELTLATDTPEGRRHALLLPYATTAVDMAQRLGRTWFSAQHMARADAVGCIEVPDPDPESSTTTID
jgi:hypothetical protein